MGSRVNHRRSSWAFLPLFVSLAALAALIAPWGCGSGGGGGTATSAPTKGNVAIGFVGSVPAEFPGFRSILLNISAVRLNRKKNAPLGGSHWVTIPVPSGARKGAGSSPGDLQIDLNNLQNGAMLFNTTRIPVGNYKQVQVEVNPNIPGTIVPACPGINNVSKQEGCANYPLVFTDPSKAIKLSQSTPLITVSKRNLSVLLLQLNLSIDTTPTSAGGAYAITVTPSVVDANSYLGTVTGTVSRSGSSSGSLSVSAELTGTGNVVATVPVTGGNFSLDLPGAPNAGTEYDLFVSGRGSTFDAQHDITVFPGSKPGLEFNVKGTGTANIRGKIKDTCTSAGIPGATVEILAPASNVPSSTDCSANPPDCVVVGTTSTDETGAYPLPLTYHHPSIFTKVPTGADGLALEISASGYTTLITKLKAGAGKQTCPDSISTTSSCSFSLPTGYISGTVSLTQAPPPGQSVQAQVFAENTGTNDLVSTLGMPLTFRSGQTTATFKLNVPLASDPSQPTPVFDLFAAAIDPYLGATDPYPGHTIAVLSPVTGPASQCDTTANQDIPALECVGHGSISGTVANPNPNLETIVEVLEDGVQILGTTPGLLGPINNSYALCVPPGTYTLERLEQSASGGEHPPDATATAVVPVPSPASTPCPTSCSLASDNSSCPGQCFTPQANPL
jgi:Domain of unknown function (DUF4382)